MSQKTQQLAQLLMGLLDDNQSSYMKRMQLKEVQVKLANSQSELTAATNAQTRSLFMEDPEKTLLLIASAGASSGKASLDMSFLLPESIDMLTKPGLNAEQTEEWREDLKALVNRMKKETPKRAVEDAMRICFANEKAKAETGIDDLVPKFKKNGTLSESEAITVFYHNFSNKMRHDAVITDPDISKSESAMDLETVMRAYVPVTDEQRSLMNRGIQTAKGKSTIKDSSLTILPADIKVKLGFMSKMDIVSAGIEATYESTLNGIAQDRSLLSSFVRSARAQHLAEAIFVKTSPIFKREVEFDMAETMVENTTGVLTERSLRKREEMLYKELKPNQKEEVIAQNTKPEPEVKVEKGIVEDETINTYKAVAAVETKEGTVSVDALSFYDLVGKAKAVIPEDDRIRERPMEAIRRMREDIRVSGNQAMVTLACMVAVTQCQKAEAKELLSGETLKTVQAYAQAKLDYLKEAFVKGNIAEIHPVQDIKQLGELLLPEEMGDRLTLAVGMMADRIAQNANARNAYLSSDAPQEEKGVIAILSGDPQLQSTASKDAAVQATAEKIKNAVTQHEASFQKSRDQGVELELER